MQGQPQGPVGQPGGGGGGQQLPMRNPMLGDQPNDTIPILAKILQNQPRPQSGWQITASMKMRLFWLHRIFTFISLSAGTQAKPSNEQVQKMLQAATKMESDAFMQAPNADAYQNSLRNHLLRIQNMSAAQKGPNMQNPLVSQSMQPPPLMQQQNMGMMPGNFNNQNRPQMPFQGNNNPMLTQHPGLLNQGGVQNLNQGVMPNVAQQNLQQNFQQQQQQQPQPQPQPQTQQQQQQQQQPQPQPQQQQQQQQPPPPQQHQQQLPIVGNRPPGMPQWTPEDQKNINMIAKNLFTKAQQSGQISELQLRAQRMTDAQKQQLARNNLNPITFQIRQIAEKQYMHRKQQMQGQNGQNLNPPQRPESAGAMRIQTANQSGNGNGNGNGPGQANMNFNPHDFAGQQAKGFRSQADGDLVVPASNNQTFSGQQFAFGNQNGQNNQNQGSLNMRQPAGPNVQATPMNNQQAAQAQARARAQVRMNQANQKPQPQRPQSQPQNQNQDRLQGQVGGLNSFEQGAPQPSPMRTLNQPLGPPQHQNNRTPQPNQSQPTPVAPPAQFGPPATNVRPQSQGPQAGRGEPQQQTMMGNPPVPPFIAHLPPAAANFYRSLPPELRVRLNNVPQSQFQEALTQIQRSQQARALQNQQMRNPSLMPQGVGGPMPNSAPPPQMQNNNIAVGHPHLDPNGQSNVPQQGNQLTPAEQAYMDSMQLPRSIIAQFLPQLRLPPNVTTWADFKQWFRSNPATIPLQARHGISSLQRKQYIDTRRTVMLQGGGQMPPMQNSTFPNLSQDMSNQHMSRLGDVRQREVVQKGLVRVLPSGQPQVVPISNEEVQHIRIQFGQGLQTQSDDQVKKGLLRRRLEQIQREDPDLANEMNLTTGQPPQWSGQNMPPQPVPAPGQDIPNGIPPGFPPQNLNNNIPPNTQINAMNNARGRGRGQPGLSNRGGAIQGVGRGAISNTVSGPPQVNGTQKTALAASKPMTKQESVRGNGAEQQNGQPPQSQQGSIGQHVDQKPNGTANAAGAAPNPAQINAQVNEEYSKIKKSAIQATAPGEYHRIADEDFEQFSQLSQELAPLKKVFDISTKFYFTRMFMTNRQAGTRMAFETLQRWIKVSQQKVEDRQAFMSLDEYRQNIQTLQKFVHAMANHMPPATLAMIAQQTQTKPAPKAKEEDGKSLPVGRKDSIRAKSEDQPPAAPTSEKPPVSFLSPHRTPQYAVVNNFDPSKMAVPQKRKRNKAEGTEPAGLTPGNEPPMAKPAPTSVTMTRDASSQRRAMAPVKNFPFRCPIPQCEFEQRGFETQEQADSHALEAHEYKGDALDWCLGQFRDALDLDKRGRPVKKTAGTDDAAVKGTADLTLQSKLTDVRSIPLHRSKVDTTENDTASKLHSHAIETNKSPGTYDSDTDWEFCKDSRESIYYLFSDLRDFPAANHGLDAFASVKPPVPELSSDMPGSTVEELAAQGERQKKSISPSSIVRVELEDWEPFLEDSAGLYDGMEVEVVQKDGAAPGTGNDNDGFVPMTYDQAMKSLEDSISQDFTPPEAMNATDGEVDKELEDWFDWDAMDFDLISTDADESGDKDLAGNGKTDEAVKADEREGKGNSKKMKKTP